MIMPDIPLLDEETGKAWFAPNVWPAECPRLEGLCEQFTGQVRDLDTMIRPVAGDNDFEPVVAGEWLRACEAAATVS
jgi:hypothetical protein